MKMRCVSSAVLGIAVTAALTLGAEGQTTGRVNGVPTGPNAKEVEQGSPRPLDFGVQGDAVSTFSYFAFRPGDSSFGFTWGPHESTAGVWPTSYSSVAPATILAANVQVPEGAVIDYVLLDVCNSSGAAPFLVFGVSQIDQDLADVAVTNVSGCSYFTSSLLSHQVTQNAGQALDFFVNWHNGPVDGSVVITRGEVWWHRAVSPAPATADFGDVPTSSPQFQFVEALFHAGVTAGCGGGNYCPNNPVTRGQMAVFLAKALGLYWPN
jgi:hypothetical protein